MPKYPFKTNNVYLEEVESCDVYIGLFGNEYGSEDSEGISPTEREFDLVSQKGKPCLIFVKGNDDKLRHPRMIKLIRKAGSQLIRRRFDNYPYLTSGVYASLIEYMESGGDIRSYHLMHPPVPGQP